jgi:hypothetical protein
LAASDAILSGGRIGATPIAPEEATVAFTSPTADNA